MSGSYLDPTDWEAARRAGHRMIDDMLEYLRNRADDPVWRPVPERTKEFLRQPAPVEPRGLEAAYAGFVEHILPYTHGNTHPRAWGWVTGTGTVSGMYGDLLAGGLNANVWGGEHAPLYVEAQVIEWMRSLLGFPDGTSGILVTGASMATLLGLAVGRAERTGGAAIEAGMRDLPRQPVVYASTQTHNSVDKAVELLGIGRRYLRHIPVDDEFRIDVAALERAIAEDRAGGLEPMCLVGNAGTVNTGAVDDLSALAHIARRERLWFHVDGAFGAIAALSPKLRGRVAGLQAADSLAFDLHKWLYIQYDVGAVLVRDRSAHRAAFAAAASYLKPLDRGPAHGPHQWRDYGIDLSRGFRALKAWMSLTAEGTARFVAAIERNAEQAAELAELVEATPGLELMAPVPLNVVCFRFAPEGLDPIAIDALNREILLRIQERGIALPSHTELRGRFAIRAAIVNHRTTSADLRALVEAVVAVGAELGTPAVVS